MALSDHKDTLFRAVDASKPEQGIKQETKDILYRSGAATTQSHPVPTAAELSCIESTEKGLGISRCEAAVLLRDYLDESKGNGVAGVLDHCSDLMDIAPIDAWEDWKAFGSGKNVMHIHVSLRYVKAPHRGVHIPTTGRFRPFCPRTKGI